MDGIYLWGVYACVLPPFSCCEKKKESCSCDYDALASIVEEHLWDKIADMRHRRRAAC